MKISTYTNLKFYSNGKRDAKVTDCILNHRIIIYKKIGLVILYIHNTCQYTNAIKCKKSSEQNITCLFFILGIPRYLSQPEAALVRVGDSQMLSCEVNPDLVSFIQWERNKELVRVDERVFVLPNKALVISNATEMDAGLYRCVIENAGPIKTSEEAEIQILPGKKSQWYFILEFIEVKGLAHPKITFVSWTTGSLIVPN